MGDTWISPAVSPANLVGGGTVDYSIAGPPGDEVPPRAVLDGGTEAEHPAPGDPDGGLPLVEGKAKV